MMQDKDHMLAFVSEEVERLKGMFTAKEQRLTEERDSALSQHESVLRDADSARAKLQAAERRVTAFPDELEVREVTGRLLPTGADQSGCALSAESEIDTKT